MKKRVISLITALILAGSLLLADCPVYGAQTPENEDWAFYLYMCGSNLESQFNSATSDILEMLDADIPDNVKLYVFTGGAKEWDPEGIGAAYNEEHAGAYIEPSNEYAQLFSVDDDKMTLLKTYDSNLDMGDQATALQFVNDVTALGQTDHAIISFWNHGGGPLGGAEQDENTKHILSMSNIAETLKAGVAARGNRKFDLIGFDACLMSSLEIAYMLSPYGDYLVASEETEPGEGWDYSFLSAMNEEPESGTPKAVQIGKSIVDAYAYSFDENGNWANSSSCTLALTDLSRMGAARDAFDDLASDMASVMKQDQETFVQIARTAEVTQADKSVGVIDLYDFVDNIKDIEGVSDSARRLAAILGMPCGTDPEHYVGDTLSVDGIQPAVLYRGTCDVWNESLGLSFFYPVLSYGFTLGSQSFAERNLTEYEKLGVSDSYLEYLAGITVNAELLNSFKGKISVETLENTDEFVYVATVTPANEIGALKSVRYIQLCDEIDPSGSIQKYFMGEDIADTDWQKGTFTKKVEENWFTLEGNFITLNRTVSREGDNITEYSYDIPVMMDGGLKILKCLAYKTSPDYGDSVLNGLVFVKYVYDPQSSETAKDRLTLPEGGITFSPVLAKYDLQTNQITDYKVYDEITLNDSDTLNGQPVYMLPLKETPVRSGQDVTYMGYFQATDFQNSTFVSEPVYFANIVSLDEFKVGITPPQVYTGQPVTPHVRLLFQNAELLEEGVDYQVTFANNTEPGTATFKVTSEYYPGELTGSFVICQEKDLAEEYVKLLPDHKMEECPSYEVYEHIPLLEKAMYYYASGLELTAGSLEKLNAQYNDYVSAFGLTLTDGDVEVIGVFSAYDWVNNLGIFYPMKLSAPAGMPGAGAPLEAYEKALQAAMEKNAGSEAIGCYKASVMTKTETPEPVIFEEGKSLTYKIKIPQGIRTDSLTICGITEDGSESAPLEYQIVTRDGVSYAMFDTDVMGYFALFAAKEPESESPDPGQTTEPSKTEITKEPTKSGGAVSPAATQAPAASKSSDSKPSASGSAAAAKTGDTESGVLLACLALISMGGLWITSAVEKRRRKNCGRAS